MFGHPDSDFISTFHAQNIDISMLNSEKMRNIHAFTMTSLVIGHLYHNILSENAHSKPQLMRDKKY